MLKKIFFWKKNISSNVKSSNQETIAGKNTYPTRTSLIGIVVASLLVGALAGGIISLYASSYILNTFIPQFIEQPFYSLIRSSDTGEEEDYQEEQRVIQSVEEANQSVVSIVVSKYVTRYYGGTGSDFFEWKKEFFGDLWPQIFNNSPESQPQQKTEKQEVSGGTGFVISADGLILTNKHVVSDEEAEYTVVTNEGEKYEAQVLARDPFNDIAVLKIEMDNLAPVKLGDSDKLQLGQTVIAIGNALGEYCNTVTKGVISGIDRRIIAGSVGRSEVLEDVIQTDAAINYGNSGGPLINLKGEVIGINTAISNQGQLIGFAIPINQAKQVIESVKEHGRIIRPFLGVRYIPLNESIAQENNLEVNYGALVVRGEQAGQLAVIPGSPADKAGLVENDIILELNGEKVTQEHSLSGLIQQYQPGEEIELKILHKGEEKMVKVVLEEYGNE